MDGVASALKKGDITRVKVHKKLFEATVVGSGRCWCMHMNIQCKHQLHRVLLLVLLLIANVDSVGSLQERKEK